MALVERHRILEKRPMERHRVIRLNGALWQEFHENLDVYSSEWVQSEGHRWPKDRGVRDAGGPFWNVKLKYFNHDYGYYNYHRDDLNGFTTDGYGHAMPAEIGSGSLFTNPNPGIATASYFMEDKLAYSNLNVAGTNFISKTIPTNPIVDGSVSLAELFREGIPSAISAVWFKERAAFFRNLGDDYLNIEFGWKPFLSDLRKAALAIHHSNEMIKNLADNSGKDLHRHSFTPEKVSPNGINSFTDVYYPSISNGGDFSPPPWYRISDVSYQKTWFSGCYTYHFDPGTMSKFDRIATEARLLYGIQVTPEVLWNLAPWSWLVDWFVNYGPMLHNLSAFQSDGLVLKYGYVMEHSRRIITRKNDVGTYSRVGSNTYPLHYADKFYGESKRRAKATPFGFGLNSSDFTNRQWAILAALGITRAYKTFP